MVPIGFSTGAIRGTGLPLAKRLELLLKCGATAVEINLREDLTLGDKVVDTQELLESFAFVSAHLPKEPLTIPMIASYRKLADCIPAQYFTVHPGSTPYDILATSGIPVALENLDSRCSVAITPKEFVSLRERYQFSYVLDLQHLFEHDSLMQTMREYHNAMGPFLRYYHVSGQNTESSHAPLIFASNRATLARHLPDLKKPIILEGVTDDIEVITDELQYVHGALRHHKTVS